tara:strand:+ start:51 stop:920 length:870 start_codon:yes stop_codon:yes gene_type:complete
MKKISYLFEFFIIYFIFFVFKLIPINLVSFIGGKVFQLFGPFSKSHQTAKSNFKKVFPHLSEKEFNNNISMTWNNLGKTIIEFTILNKLLSEKNKRIKIVGIEYLSQIKKKKEQVIFFGIHQSNWELMVPLIDKFGINVSAIYRHINNPYINKFILNIRNKTLHSKKTFYTPKGRESAKRILESINKGQSIILLIDQKDSAGSDVKLFNYNVKTQIGFLKIAKKNNLKLIPIQTIREKINNFKIIVHQPIDPYKNYQNDIEVMTKIHSLIENWIKENPDQWLWQHKRFD